MDKNIRNNHEDHIEEVDQRAWLRFTQSTADQIDKRSNENSKVLESIWSTLESM